MNEKEYLYRAIKLLKENETVSISIVKPDNTPYIYAMEKVSSNELINILFITKKNSNKVSYIKNNNRVGVLCNNSEDSITMSGIIEIIEDEAIKKEVLPDDYWQRISKRDSTLYCVLSFTVEVADLYISGKKMSVSF